MKAVKSQDVLSTGPASTMTQQIIIKEILEKASEVIDSQTNKM